MKRVLENLRGAAALMSLTGISLLCFVPLLPAALAKLLLPWPRPRRYATVAVLAIARGWARAVNAAILALSGARVSYEQRLADHPEGRYVLISNHQCWADVLLLVYVIESRLPFPRYFIKERLRWLPVVGLACWALDFPFMKRHSRAAIANNPALRDEDMNRIRRACAIFRDWPVSLVNYAEGTRSTAAKRAAAASPYRALLPPKAGGTAFAVNAMRDVLDGVLDMTVAYVDAAEPTFWDFLCGRIARVVVRVQPLALPEALRVGDYGSDPDYRARFKAWLERVWAEKDGDVAALQDPRHPARRFSQLRARPGSRRPRSGGSQAIV